MFERFLLGTGDKIIVFAHQFVQRFPFKFGNTLLYGRCLVICRSPFRESAVIAGTTPISGFFIEPECTISCMAGHKHRRITGWRNGIYQTVAFGCHLQFVCNRGNTQMLGRRRNSGMLALELFVIHTIYRSKRLTVQPAFTHNTVFIRAGTTHETGNGRSAVGIGKRILCLSVDTALFQQTHKTPFAV